MAIEAFRQERLEEPLEAYLQEFDTYQGIIENLFETTIDLSALDEQTVTNILCDTRSMEVFRYLPGPPISEDDLKTLADVVSFNAGRLRSNPDYVRRIAEVIRSQLDRRRFPWVSEEREPSEHERGAAVLASAALMAVRRLETERRHSAKNMQEQQVDDILVLAGLVKVSPRTVMTFDDAPRLGEFCREAKLGDRKADLIVRLWDGRVLPIECKVSNSATNSVKRLNNDAAVKAETWRHDFGQTQVIPAAVLSGVYKVHNLMDAQRRGLVVFWAHNLRQLTDWIECTRP